jgi:hypothetical protein
MSRSSSAVGGAPARGCRAGKAWRRSARRLWRKGRVGSDGGEAIGTAACRCVWPPPGPLSRAPAAASPARRRAARPPPPRTRPGPSPGPAAPRYCSAAGAAAGGGRSGAAASGRRGAAGLTSQLGAGSGRPRARPPRGPLDQRGSRPPTGCAGSRAAGWGLERGCLHPSRPCMHTHIGCIAMGERSVGASACRGRAPGGVWRAPPRGLRDPAAWACVPAGGRRC